MDFWHRGYILLVFVKPQHLALELLVSLSLKLEITVKGSYDHGQVRLSLHMEQNEVPQKCRIRRVRFLNQSLNLKPVQVALNTSLSQQ